MKTEKPIFYVLTSVAFLLLLACTAKSSNTESSVDTTATASIPVIYETDRTLAVDDVGGLAMILSRTKYKDKLRGFWLGSCIANWTGLPTENRRTDFPFFTDADFGPGKYDFVLDQSPWGADDDTDIEYVYQHAIEKFNHYLLTGEQISSAWRKHIGLPKLWVSNLSALGQMHNGAIPPATSLPENNPMWDMIDAQLTT